MNRRNRGTDHTPLPKGKVGSSCPTSVRPAVTGGVGGDIYTPHHHHRFRRTETETPNP